MNTTLDPRTVLSYSLTPSSPQAKKEHDLESLRKSCREFETILLTEMYKAMRKAVPDGGLFEKSMASDMYQEMFDAEIAKETASGPGVGIGDAMYRQMAELIEKKKYE